VFIRRIRPEDVDEPIQDRLRNISCHASRRYAGSLTHIYKSTVYLYALGKETSESHILDLQGVSGAAAHRAASFACVHQRHASSSYALMSVLKQN
jgi:hypothetical protein